MIKMPNWVENILEVRGGADTLREFRGPSDKHAVSKEPGVHKYTFDTANAAPYDWAVEAAAQHPELNVQLTYGEDGNFYGGQIVFEHGVKKSHVGGPYHAFFYTDSDVEDEASVEDDGVAELRPRVRCGLRAPPAFRASRVDEQPEQRMRHVSRWQLPHPMLLPQLVLLMC